ncbi:MAG: gephyrin-like molybdotransferase Glp [Pseudomonadota bacterium]
MIEKQPSCADENETGLLPVATAVARVRELITPIAESHTVGIREALNRVLASDVISPIDVPGYRNSAMDGYAIYSDDIPDQGESELRVIGTAWAGRPSDADPQRGECVRIMTGAMMPQGCDTVVIQEHVRVEDSSIAIDDQVEVGRNVREAGEDMQAGETVLVKGTRVRPAQLGLLASLGIAKVEVKRKPVVAFFTTGDELRSLDEHAGEPLGAGELFDSNRYTLFGMLSRLGVDIIDLGVVPDDSERTRSAFLEATQHADLVITSGGVSAGAADFVTQTLHEIGDVSFWKLAMRPGRPLACGRVGDALFFGLPGNPVAVMVTFYEFVKPAIAQLMGCVDLDSPTVRVPCISHLKKSRGRVEYQRGIYTCVDGEMQVITTGKQGAGRLSSMSAANCMIVLPAEVDTIEPGTLVDVQLFEGLV